MQCTKCGAPQKEGLKTRLLFMRHGTTDLNERSISVGSIDEALNDRGRAQAEKCAEKLLVQGEKIDLIVSSPMKRAKETAKIIGQKLDVRIIFDHLLRERCVGEIEGKPETLESDAQLLRYDFLPEGAEPLELFEKERTAKFLAEIPGKYDGKTILFITHGFWMLDMIKLIHGWDVPRIMAYAPPGNCEVVEFSLGETCPSCGNHFFEK